MGLNLQFTVKYREVSLQTISLISIVWTPLVKGYKDVRFKDSRFKIHSHTYIFLQTPDCVQTQFLYVMNSYLINILEYSKGWNNITVFPYTKLSFKIKTLRLN